MRHDALRFEAVNLDAAIFAGLQRQLAHFNRERLAPGLGMAPSSQQQAQTDRMTLTEQAFIEGAREIVKPLSLDAPSDADAFVSWFESLREWGPGQGDTLFPWLAEKASLEDMRWFLSQEVAGEVGFEDLLAMVQVKMPEAAKLEMARNYWDEMGRGRAGGMHGPMLEQLAQHFELKPTPEKSVPEALALGNMMVGLAMNRRYAFHGVGALGVIELTAPGRAAHVAKGLRRLGVPAKESHYFTLHAVLDVKHSAAWNREVIRSLVAEDSARAAAIAEGALLRLWCGKRCFERYRRELAVA